MGFDVDEAPPWLERGVYVMPFTDEDGNTLVYSVDRAHRRLHARTVSRYQPVAPVINELVTLLDLRDPDGRDVARGAMVRAALDAAQRTAEGLGKPAPPETSPPAGVLRFPGRAG